MSMNLPDKKFAIIIPSYNDTDFLEACLRSLYSSDAGASWSLVVVDDFSDQAHARQLQIWARELNFHLLRTGERQYFSRTINQGIIYAHENIAPYWYFLLNSDTEVTPGWGRAVLDTHFSSKAHIIGATLLHPDGRVQHAGAYGEGHHMGMDEDWVRWQQDRDVPWCTGAALFLHRDIIDKVSMMPLDKRKRPGQYDASDRNLAVAARNVYGYEVTVSANCVIYHRTHQSREMRLEAGHIYAHETA